MEEERRARRGVSGRGIRVLCNWAQLKKDKRADGWRERAAEDKTECMIGGETWGR